MSSSKTYSFLTSLVLLVTCGMVSFYWGFKTNRDKTFPYAHVSPTLAIKAGISDKDRLWARKLTEGGYILHVRHGKRERWQDVTAFDAYELASGIKAENASFRRAVCLTDQGVEEAKLIGSLFDLVGVQIQSVISSPSCRARQTAMSAFGKVDVISNALIHRTAIMKRQHKDFARELRALFDGISVAPGQNVVLTGHSKTLKYNLGEVVDVDESGGMDVRLETGIAVMEKVDGKVIARHKFESIREFAHAIVELPVKSAQLAANLPQ